MNTYLNLASGTLLLFLVLMLASLSTSLVLKWLGGRRFRGDLGHWLADNESSVLAAVWAAVAVSAYFLGPRLLMSLATQAGLSAG